MKTRIFKLLLCAVTLFMGGCFSVKTTPHLGFRNFDIRTEMSREDIEVLGQVEGSSTTESIILGLIQVVDGDKLRLLGIPFGGVHILSQLN